MQPQPVNKESARDFFPSGKFGGLASESLEDVMTATTSTPCSTLASGQAEAVSTLCRNMNELAYTIADDITDAAEPFDVQDDSLLLAHEIIAKVRIAGFMPCDHQVATSEFGPDDVAALRDALITYARTHLDHPSRGSSYWGLAALCDVGNLHTLRDLLQIESSKEFVDEDVLCQIMTGLDKIGEAILTPIQSDPVNQAGDRWAAAKLCLARHS